MSNWKFRVYGPQVYQGPNSLGGNSVAVIKLSFAPDSGAPWGQVSLNFLEEGVPVPSNSEYENGGQKVMNVNFPISMYSVVKEAVSRPDAVANGGITSFAIQ
ncbi:hypothetical protein [Pseudoalteromonas sp. OOF1S-7]|uniref:hypothetical protein n=1 Tax=Pseudoalteromonas sp. OOF1S-7 TaxID=2917757 RepID=UPI001EF73190|nr:hypothetical protein [Pseudoalteromonas sp. OOF1S-7]MCG7536584.1 hypothetical protein [Pseudoalteromonas sp. OOF1S-7]